MTPSPISPDLYGDIVQTAGQPGFRDWLAMVKATGGCAEPIHLWGHSRTLVAQTGEVLSERPLGRLMVACGNRRSSRCPSCSETYRADTYQLIRAGLVGGKSVPDAVRERPRLFATFTASSFGPVHHRTLDENGRPKRCHPFGAHACGRCHEADDPELGQPLEPESYNYVGAVTWNALSTRLWARTVQLANRKAARMLGIRQQDWPEFGRVSVAKVVEYQARGVVHFHAVFRLDGPESDVPPPTGTTIEVLEAAIRYAASKAEIALPDSSALGGQAPVVWGEQLDVKPIEATEADGMLSDSQVAGYIAKYATKGAENTGTIDRSVCCGVCKGTGQITSPAGEPVFCARCHGTGLRQALAELKAHDHARRMIETCWTLGGRLELRALRLRPWAHMLGFRGHFSTKSRRYSTTLTKLRTARMHWQDDRTRRAHGLDPETRFVRVPAEGLDDLTDELDPDDETVLVLGHWANAGRGHTAGEAVFAATIARDQAENRQIYRQMKAVHHDWQDAA
jgi:hypothetical protein